MSDLLCPHMIEPGPGDLPGELTVCGATIDLEGAVFSTWERIFCTTGRHEECPHAKRWAEAMSNAVKAQDKRRAAEPSVAWTHGRRAALHRAEMAFPPGYDSYRRYLRTKEER